MKNLLRSLIARNYFLLSLFIKIRSILKPDKNETGGTVDADYCYSLFLRTFNYSKITNKNKIPQYVLEVGCGDSNVVALLWLLVGAKKVVSIDAYEYLNKNKILKVFEKASKILIDKSFCQLGLNPKLNIDVYENLWKLIDSREKLLSRREMIINEIKRFINNEKVTLFSYNPNYTIKTKFNFKFNLIFSQAVFEHVRDPEKVFNFLHKNLDKKGIIYTSIDFKSHGVSTLKNGHYLLTENQYNKISSPFVFRYINRLPPSWFRKLLNKKYCLISEKKVITKSYIKLNQVPIPNITEEDLLVTSSVFITSNN